MKRIKVLLTACAVMVSGTAWSAPGLINYQGRLTDLSDNPITTSTDVTFTFWDAESGGSQIGSFSDLDTVTPDANGIYATLVGDDPGNLVPASVFAADGVWLNVNIEGEDLAPRVRVVSAGFAIQAEDSNTLQGLEPTAFLNMSADAYVLVRTTSSATQNGTNLLAAYTQAKTLTPNGSALAADNRAAVLVPPGRYDLGTGSITLDTEYVDLVGLSTARADQHLISEITPLGIGVLNQTADDVRIENLTVEISRPTGTAVTDDTLPAAYFPDSNLPNTVVRNCEFTQSTGAIAVSMRLSIEYSGEFTDCKALSNGFGSFGGIASGTFKDCDGGNNSFGNNGMASGTFINCVAGNNSFARGASSHASGTFIDCSAGEDSFGRLGFADGTFRGCTAGNRSFGGDATGTFIDCEAGDESFGGANQPVTGTFINCTGGDRSFGEGSFATISGAYTHCVAGANSFGGSNADNTGARLHGCRMTGSTWTGTFNGRMQDCQWGSALTLGADARIYNSTFLGDVDLNSTTAGIANSYVNDQILNAGSASFNSGNLESADIN